MPKDSNLKLTPDRWNEVAELIASGASWAQAGYKTGLPARLLKAEGEKRGLKKGMKPQIEFVAMSPESSAFLQNEPTIVRVNQDDPELCLISVRQKLTTVVNGIEKTILEPEKEAEWMNNVDPVSRFAQHSKQEGYGVREYISILKDIAKLATAHMPYRHATLSAIAIKDIDKSNGIKSMSREEKRKRLTNLLEQAGVLDVTS